VSAAAWIRIGVIASALVLVEALCRGGIISPFTMPAPSAIVGSLGAILGSGHMLGQIARTLADVAVAFILAVIAGFLLGAGLVALPRVRAVIEPMLASYYAIPVFVFYPFFVVVFGLNHYPRIAIGFLLAVVAMVINTLNGFDRVPPVLLKSARVLRLSRIATVRHVLLPFAALYISTGLKLAVAYAFIGVIAAEFILSGDGMGYEIAFAFNNFDNRVMYPLILVLLVVATTVNMGLYAWERRFLARQTGHRDAP
jgi:NitT/TauT family transport system permease protein